ncbi:DUF3253 domain-containing protein [Aquisalinus flavus]|uniref:DUF3253 domain-containing protein n=1 Tax=Aquisalinus flavus TaxID=1526572 RepID=A0A8J2V4P7_9PROT|nr:DUF3253 domain-containing protein [Aquisalinus flavus]MBD0427177.1 DUF3253 domain-containing protein [Aquisalinus flavus]UNE46993.1 DUF3253 domain-containing protein [Aquisalinus flavus]GGC98967.1 hypothetical protein GCM10011342_04900 [Aquisalinus flavus]
MSNPRDAILTLLAQRDPGKSICPSEAAKALAPDNWQPEMHRVREAGRALSDEGLIEVTRKGKPVDPHTVKGVIRYRLK